MLLDKLVYEVLNLLVLVCRKKLRRQTKVFSPNALLAPDELVDNLV
jgi:hypothetical protein